MSASYFTHRRLVCLSYDLFIWRQLRRAVVQKGPDGGQTARLWSLRLRLSGEHLGNVDFFILGGSNRLTLFLCLV